MRHLTKRPRSIAPGRVLVHNHVSHTVDMESGENGFRFWTLPEGELSAISSGANADGPACRTIGGARRTSASMRCMMAASHRPGLIQINRAG
jgi:hypothetical protein